MVEPQPSTAEGDQWSGQRVNRLWALVAINEAGDEGIVAVQDLPIVVSQDETKEKLTPALKEKGVVPASGQTFMWREFKHTGTEEQIG